ncbi:hypothetical protein SLS62_003630 [Diatrype stigma]|uniref:Uncharacterized protein n=1 Tax=Diatrype stigma TaxID=117547 RepID=A0AAN9YTS4_9PEZI
MSYRLMDSGGMPPIANPFWHPMPRFAAGRHYPPRSVRAVAADAGNADGSGNGGRENNSR